MNNSKFTFFWFNDDNQPESLSIDMERKESFLIQLLSRLKKNKLPKNTQWITTISSRYIWQKSFVFSNQLKPEERIQQALFSVQNELPLSFDEIWFDFNEQIIDKNNSIRMDLFMISQKQARNYLDKYYPIRITVLDNQFYAIKRAFHYLIVDKQFNSPSLTSKNLFIYENQVSTVILAETLTQLLVFEKTSQKTTALFEQFCQQYSFSPEKIFVFREIGEETPSFPENWIIVETHLPFIALGNALWDGNESRENKNEY